MKPFISQSQSIPAPAIASRDHHDLLTIKARASNAAFVPRKFHHPAAAMLDTI
jgi:hypothetical protein